MKKEWLAIIFLTSALGLAGCGGGSGSDDDDDDDDTSTTAAQAEITADNADDLAVTATSALEQAKAGNNLPTAVARPVETAARTGAQNVSQSCSSFGAGAGGTYTVNTSSNGNSFSIDYACTNPSITGSAVITYSPSIENAESFTINYNDFSYAGETFQASYTCTGLQSTSISCDYEYDGNTFGGGSFSYSGNTLSGTDSGGYNGSVTISDGTYGSYTITVSNVTYTEDCGTGYPVPTTGTVTMTGSGGTEAVITYNGCVDATVTIDGVSTTITWASI